MKEKQLLELAASEIRQLRTQNEILSAKVNTFESVIRAVEADAPRRPQRGSIHPDPLAEIDRYLTKEKAGK